MLLKLDLSHGSKLLSFHPKYPVSSALVKTKHSTKMTQNVVRPDVLWQRRRFMVPGHPRFL